MSSRHRPFQSSRRYHSIINSSLATPLREIAWEKAGILKRNTLGVVTHQSPEALEVIQEVAASIGATLKIQGHHWHAVGKR